jgi:hypothetical protein
VLVPVALAEPGPDLTPGAGGEGDDSVFAGYPARRCWQLSYWFCQDKDCDGLDGWPLNGLQASLRVVGDLTQAARGGVDEKRPQFLEARR